MNREKKQKSITDNLCPEARSINWLVQILKYLNFVGEEGILHIVILNHGLLTFLFYGFKKNIRA